MSKQLVVFLVAACVLSGCGVAGSAGMVPGTSSQLAAQGAKYMTPKMDAGGAKPSQSDLGPKEDAGAAKPQVALKVRLPEARELKQGLGSKDLVAIANMTLASMNAASDYESGAKIGFAALKKLNESGLGNAMLVVGSHNAAAATKTWQDAYKVLAVALDELRQEREPQTAVFGMAIAMMDACESYEAGARAGSAMMKSLNKNHASESIRALAVLSNNQAASTKDWGDAFSVLKAGFKQMNSAK